MEQKLDLHGIDPQTLDPKQEEELFASLSDEELAEVAGGSFVESGHVCGDFGGFNTPEEVRYDFEVGTRVQVTRNENTWSSWSGTIIDRTIESKDLIRVGLRHCVMYRIHFDGYDSTYDKWYDQHRLYI